MARVRHLREARERLASDYPQTVERVCPARGLSWTTSSLLARDCRRLKAHMKEAA